MIVGLGNPGKQYEKTRHNIGFMIIDKLAQEMGTTVSKKQSNALVEQGKIGNNKVLLVKPQTYMNLSGQAVQQLLNFYKEGISDLIVIYDDLDLELGKLRFRDKGSAGGHNGIKSMIQCLNSQDFPRLKVGIGRPPSFMQTADYVLGTFSKEEGPIIDDSMQKACEGIKVWMKEGINITMNKFNSNS